MRKFKYPRRPSEHTEREREGEILRLELERDGINRELYKLARRYARLIGDTSPISGLKPIGSRPNDFSYWHDL